MAVGNKEVVVVEEIVKARTDKREYRRIVLPNSLEVLLISDHDTDKCAASMDVNVGAFSDPDGLEGLAHFLASLTLKMVEALACTSDWLRTDEVNFYKKPTENMLLFYKEMKEVETSLTQAQPQSSTSSKPPSNASISQNLKN